MILAFLNQLVVVICGFLIAFAIAAHVFFPGGAAGGADGSPSEKEEEQREAEARRAQANEMEQTAASKTALHPEMQLPPAVLIRRRWNMPSCVAKEMGVWVELIVRDFLMNWYLVDQQASGISNDPAFLEYCQYLIANTLGNLGYRASNLSVSQLLTEDVTEVLRHHLKVFDCVHASAARRHPDLFSIPPASADVLLAHGKLRLQLGAEQNSGSADEASASTPLSDADIISRELRQRRSAQERALCSEYQVLGGLHPACDVSSTPILGAEDNPQSWANRTGDYAGPVTPKEWATMEGYMRGVASQVLEKLLPPNEKESIASNLLVREILGNKVFLPMLDSASDPFTLAELLVEGLGGSTNSTASTTSNGNASASSNGSASASAAASATTAAVPAAVAAPAVPSVASAKQAAPVTMTPVGSPSLKPAQPPITASPRLPVPTGAGSSPMRESSNASLTLPPPSSLSSLAAPPAPAAFIWTPRLAPAPAKETDFDAASSSAPTASAASVTTATPTHGSSDASLTTASASASASASGDVAWRYFAGSMTRAEAEAVLAVAPKGAFLLRAREGGTFVLSYLRDSTVDSTATALAPAPAPSSSSNGAASGLPPRPVSMSAAVLASASSTGGHGRTISKEQSSSSAAGLLQLASSPLARPSDAATAAPNAVEVAHSIVKLQGNAFHALGRGPYPSLSALLRGVRDLVWVGVTVETATANAPAVVTAPEGAVVVKVNGGKTIFVVRAEHLYTGAATEQGGSSYGPSAASAVARENSRLKLQLAEQQQLQQPSSGSNEVSQSSARTDASSSSSSSLRTSSSSQLSSAAPIPPARRPSASAPVSGLPPYTHNPSMSGSSSGNASANAILKSLSFGLLGAPKQVPGAVLLREDEEGEENDNEGEEGGPAEGGASSFLSPSKPAPAAPPISNSSINNGSNKPFVGLPGRDVYSMLPPPPPPPPAQSQMQLARPASNSGLFSVMAPLFNKAARRTSSTAQRLQQLQEQQQQQQQGASGGGMGRRRTSSRASAVALLGIFSSKPKPSPATGKAAALAGGAKDGKGQPLLLEEDDGNDDDDDDEQAAGAGDGAARLPVPDFDSDEEEALEETWRKLGRHTSGASGGSGKSAADKRKARKRKGLAHDADEAAEAVASDEQLQPPQGAVFSPEDTFSGGEYDDDDDDATDSLDDGDSSVSSTSSSSLAATDSLTGTPRPVRRLAGDSFDDEDASLDHDDEDEDDDIDMDGAGMQERPEATEEDTVPLGAASSRRLFDPSSSSSLFSSSATAATPPGSGPSSPSRTSTAAAALASKASTAQEPALGAAAGVGANVLSAQAGALSRNRRKWRRQQHKERVLSQLQQQQEEHDGEDDEDDDDHEDDGEATTATAATTAAAVQAPPPPAPLLAVPSAPSLQPATAVSLPLLDVTVERHDREEEDRQRAEEVLVKDRVVPLRERTRSSVQAEFTTTTTTTVATSPRTSPHTQQAPPSHGLLHTGRSRAQTDAAAISEIDSLLAISSAPLLYESCAGLRVAAAVASSSDHGDDHHHQHPLSVATSVAFAAPLRQVSALFGIQGNKSHQQQHHITAPPVLPKLTNGASTASAAPADSQAPAPAPAGAPAVPSSSAPSSTAVPPAPAPPALAVQCRVIRAALKKVDEIYEQRIKGISSSSTSATSATGNATANGTSASSAGGTAGSAASSKEKDKDKDKEGQQAVVWYVLQVIVNGGEYLYSVRHRYSEFLALHTAIKAAMPSFTAKFPPKTTFLLSSAAATSLTGEFVEGRRSGLDSWLQAVLATPQLVASKEFRTFIEPHAFTLVSRLQQPSHPSQPSAPTSRSAPSPSPSPSSSRKLVTFASPAADADADEAPAAVAPTRALPSPSASASSPSASALSSSSALASSSSSSSLRRRKSSHGKIAISTSTTQQDEKDKDKEGETHRSHHSHNSGHHHGHHTMKRHSSNGSSGAVSKHTPGSSAGGDYTSEGNATANSARHHSQQATASALSPVDLSRSEARIFGLLFDWFTIGGSTGSVGVWMRRQLMAFIRTLFRYAYASSASAKVSAAYQRLLAPEQLAVWITKLRTDVLWPGGRLKDPAIPATFEEQWAMRDESLTALLSVAPSAAASVLGKTHLENGLIKLHAMMMIPVVCRSLVFSLFDVLLKRLFPGIAVASLRQPNYRLLGLPLRRASNAANLPASATTSAANGGNSGMKVEVPPMLYSRYLLGGTYTDQKVAALAALAAAHDRIAAASASAGGSGTPVLPTSAFGFSALGGPLYGLPLSPPPSAPSFSGPGEASTSGGDDASATGAAGSSSSASASTAGADGAASSYYQWTMRTLGVSSAASASASASTPQEAQQASTSAAGSANGGSSGSAGNTTTFTSVLASSVRFLTGGASKQQQ